MNPESVNSIPWEFIIPTSISVIALGVSGFTLYRNYLAKFKPLITIGGVVYRFGIAERGTPGVETAIGGEFDPIPNRILGAILIPIVFIHEGGRPGVITDIMLRVSCEGNEDNWFFEPRLYVDERAFLTTHDAQAHLKWIESAFSPFPLAKGSEVRRFILFQPLSNENYPSGRLRVGQYIIHVLCKINDEHKYREIDAITVDFSIDALKNLEATVSYIPPPGSLIKSREELKKNKQVKLVKK